jgi:IS5 family transposase
MHFLANFDEVDMNPHQHFSRAQSSRRQDFPLLAHLNRTHPLIVLAGLINWEAIHQVAVDAMGSRHRRPPLPPRLIAGLLYLQHTFKLSDEEVVWGWVENPYWQVFTGETYLQTEPPINPSSLSRWRKRLGEAGVEELLAQSIGAARRAQLIGLASLKRVIVDTTVMSKAIAYPTDSALLEKCRCLLVAAACRYGLSLRQNYNRQGPHLVRQIARYAHARQFKRMRHELRILRTRVGRVQRDIERQLPGLAEHAQSSLNDLLARTRRILTQQPQDKNKLYAIHAPEVECISKGKARTRYEFGVKVSIATTLKEGVVVGARSMPGNPYDGHTLGEAVEQASIMSEVRPEMVFVDRGYRGVDVDQVQIWRSGQKRGVTRSLKAMIRRRSAIEPTIAKKHRDTHSVRTFIERTKRVSLCLSFAWTPLLLLCFLPLLFCELG